MGGPRSPHGRRVPGDTAQVEPSCWEIIISEGVAGAEIRGTPAPGQCWMDHLEPNPPTPADRALGECQEGTAARLWGDTWTWAHVGSQPQTMTGLQ